MNTQLTHQMTVAEIDERVRKAERRRLTERTRKRARPTRSRSLRRLRIAVRLADLVR